ncbi:MAG: hypothetical protein WC675_01980 [Patescibacteria group bacterium]|jgi:4-hydroxybenzoate polyprenyltransferase
MLFFETKDKGEYIYFRRKKFTLQLAFIPAICYFVLFPIIYSIFRSGALAIAIALLLLLFWFFGMWMAIEGVIAGSKIKKQKKQGKKIEYEHGESSGIRGVKIYK